MGISADCPLCLKDNALFYTNVKTSNLRSYFRCQNCDLIFCNPSEVLDPEIEQSRYIHHNNSERSEGYINFLRRLFDPITQFCSSDLKGLDYGSGPYPMMAEIADELGYSLSIYDPFFAPNDHLLNEKYDYLLCCEVAEHFRFPAQDFTKMKNLLKPKGHLGMMTAIFRDDCDFSNWYYVKDDTHISIYTLKTLDWIRKTWDFDIVYQENDVTIFQLN